MANTTLLRTFTSLVPLALLSLGACVAELEGGAEGEDEVAGRSTSGSGSATGSGSGSGSGNVCCLKVLDDRTPDGATCTIDTTVNAVDKGRATSYAVEHIRHQVRHDWVPASACNPTTLPNDFLPVFSTYTRYTGLLTHTEFPDNVVLRRPLALTEAQCGSFQDICDDWTRECVGGFGTYPAQWSDPMLEKTTCSVTSF